MVAAPAPRKPMAPAVRALNCPQCAASLSVRTFGQAVTIVCGSCLSVLDAQDPQLQAVQQFTAKQRVEPLIPLGTRGRLHGDSYEVTGFQVRTTTVDGTDYGWREYVLFNPYKGCRYLTEYDGHWNDVKPLTSGPQFSVRGRHPAATYLGKTFRHFQTAKAKTTFVLGEFPWAVRVGEVVSASDYVCPPLMLSVEATGDETTWSLGEYVPGGSIWQAFSLPGAPPRAIGVYANQPSPHAGSSAGLWAWYGLFLALVVLMAAGFSHFARQELVLTHSGRFQSGPARPGAGGGEHAFVTKVFDLQGHVSNVEVTIDTNVNNNWIYFDVALINDESGAAYEFGREVAYYSGVDSDGAWSEGSRRDEVTIPAIPSGRYYLRVEPETAAGAPLVNYTLRLRRDVPAKLFFLVAALLLVLPPGFSSLRAYNFEQRRWAESDYAPVAQDSE